MATYQNFNVIISQVQPLKFGQLRHGLGQSSQQILSQLHAL